MIFSIFSTVFFVYFEQFWSILESIHTAKKFLFIPPSPETPTHNNCISDQMHLTKALLKSRSNYNEIADQYSTLGSVKRVIKSAAQCTWICRSSRKLFGAWRSKILLIIVVRSLIAINPICILSTCFCFVWREKRRIIAKEFSFDPFSDVAFETICKFGSVWSIKRGFSVIGEKLLNKKLK